MPIHADSPFPPKGPSYSPAASGVYRCRQSHVRQTGS